MVARVKAYKAGFVTSDSNIRPNQTLAEVEEIIKKTGHSTIAVTDDGTSRGKLEGIITERDFRMDKVAPNAKVSEYMTPLKDLITGKDGISLSDANDLIWEHKVNQLPVVDSEGRLVSLVFRKDFDSHVSYPNELLDSKHRYIVGAGINTRDYMERVPALLKAGRGLYGMAGARPARHPRQVRQGR